MQPAACVVQPWIPSSVDWQSVFLPHAAACFEHVLSMHLPQSVSPSEGGGGGAAAVALAAGAALLDVSSGADDAADEALELPLSDVAVDSPPSAPEELSSAGV